MKAYASARNPVVFCDRGFEEHWIHVVKLLRAHGGCLGVRRL
jgi:hypothetical protein